jgi:hypothetical protein
MLAMLMGSFWASGLVAMEELGPFDAPYTTASHDQAVRLYADELPELEHVYGQFVNNLRPAVAANVVETSYLASEYILASGHEFLPVGGYTGEVPVPTLHQFIHYIAEGKVKNVEAATQPLTRDPDLRWVVAHCEKSGSSRDPDARATFSFFICSPTDARGG